VRWNPYGTGVVIDVLHVPDCPHVDVLRERLAAATAALGLEATVRERAIYDPVEAAAEGMYGSPTVYVDGRALGANAAGEASMSCRLALPTVDELTRALG
jgi:hypothetical protein